MIEKLLRHSYPAEQGLDPNGYTVDFSFRSGSTFFTDPISCEKCQQNRTERSSCDKKQLNIDFGDNSIVVIEFEKFAQQFDNTEAEFKCRCDYLFVDDTEAHEKIAFCDLTCSDEKWVEPNDGRYPEGKRAKAKKQMLSSLESLLHSTLLTNYLTTIKNKICIFGWREYGIPKEPVRPIRGNVSQNALAFSTTPSNMANQVRTEQTMLKHRFCFIQVKYPNIYKW